MEEMKQEFSNPWDERFSEEGFFYGKEPNVFLAEELEKINPGKALFPAEGEGRNAVYTAVLGWDVTAFDTSIEGRKKAILLADEHHVKINYVMDSHESFEAEAESFNLIACIYAHTQNRREVNRKLLKFLKPGGIILIEGFSKEQLNYNSGGPKMPELLYSVEELEKDFEGISELSVQKHILHLSEGEHHKGESSVIRLIGRK